MKGSDREAKGRDDKAIIAIDIIMISRGDEAFLVIKADLVEDEALGEGCIETEPQAKAKHIPPQHQIGA